MKSILEIPEVKAIEGPSGLVRIPNQIDVPITPRVLRLIDAPEFQRLTHISQLGVVSFVYPAAHHSRFEHSLGVYRMALLVLRRLAHQSRFVESVSTHEATVFILAALLHDIGHWPFCHPIEDLDLPGLPKHESFASAYVRSPQIQGCLSEDWQVDPQEVIDLMNKQDQRTSGRILSSILSGPIDIDKMDYLYRDSLHAGVPYGQNFDQGRLIGSLCLNEAGDRLAITQKGKTAAELMVFARYVMFSEVYWHHAVRSATAMFQRAFFIWYLKFGSTDPQVAARLFRMREQEMVRQMMADLRDDSSSDEASRQAANLLDALFGQRRQLFKRVAIFSCYEGEAIYRRIAQRPYPWIMACSQQLAELISKQMNCRITPNQVLIDAPPGGAGGSIRRRRLL